MDAQKIDVKEFEQRISDALTNGLTKQLQEAVSVKVDERMKEIGMDKLDAKYGNIPAHFLGISEDEISKMSKHEKAAKFIKAVYRKDLGTLTNMKAMGEGTDSAGGFLVPEEYAAEINRIAEDFGLARLLCRKIRMSSNILNMPTLTTNVTVSWPGEGSAGTAADLVLGRTVLEAKTCVGLSVLSNELLADANVDVVNVLSELFAEALAGEEDNQLFAGTGAPFTGLLQNSSVNIVTQATGDTGFTTFDAQDLRDLISQIKPLALSGAGFFMHRTIWGIAQKLKDSNNQPLVSLAIPVLSGDATKMGPAGTIAGTIWGYPVYLSEKMPTSSASAVSTKYIAFGNLKHAWMGDRAQMTMSISDSATVGSNNVFAENESAVRVTERIALAIGLPTAFSVLKTSAS